MRSTTLSRRKERSSTADTLYTSLQNQAVLASHFNDLRAHINTSRTYASINVGTFSFRDFLTPGSTLIKSIHIDDLRTAVK